MRKLAMISTALLGLAYVHSSHAQPAQSAPQPGLPPGAAIGAPNAQQPRATGAVGSAVTQPAPMAPMPMATAAPPPPAVHHYRRRIRHRTVTHKPLPPASTTTTQ